MKRSPKALVALALLAAAPFAASASELSYSYLEAGYTRITGSPRIDGATINGSAALGGNFHLFGGYSNLDVDGFSRNFDLWNLGLGYNIGISDRTDLVARIGYQEARLSGFGSADGWLGEVGVRSALTSNVEAFAFVGYDDVSGGSGEVFGRLGGQYKFNSNWGLSADVKFVDSDTVFFIGPRITF